MHTENNTKPTHSFDGEKFAVISTGKVIESVAVKRSRSGRLSFVYRADGKTIASGVTPAEFVSKFWGGILAPEAAPEAPGAPLADVAKAAATVAASGLGSIAALGTARAVKAEEAQAAQQARDALAHPIGRATAKHAEGPTQIAQTIARLSRFEPSGQEPRYRVVYSVGRDVHSEERLTTTVRARHLARTVTGLMERGGVIYSVAKVAQ